MKNNKGFVLVETLVVSVAIAAIFSVIYTNIVPVLGEYEKVEPYDDLDTKYIAHWMRMLIIKQGNSTLKSAMISARENNPLKMEVNKSVKLESYNKLEQYENARYLDVSTKCNSWFINPTTCLNFFKEMNVTKLYIVPYAIPNFKTFAKNNYGNSPGLQEYIESLPDYNKSSSDRSHSNYYRLIIEVEHNEGLKESEDYYTSYATVEVNKGVDSLTGSR